MATVTVTNAFDTIRMNPSGLNSIVRTYVANGVTISAGDVIQFLKLPNGAVVVDVALSGVARNTATVFDIGDAGDADRFGNDLTLSTTGLVARMNVDTGHGYLVSISDSDAQAGLIITATVVSTASATITGTINLSVTYYMKPV